MSEHMPEGNLFMTCERLERAAFRELPEGFTLRSCRPDELGTWKRMHFDTEAEAVANLTYMDEFFERVYAPRGDEFFRRCLMACRDGVPVGTCFVWKAYGRVNTVHWFKVLRGWEGRGLGRALLSRALAGLGAEDMPVCLHTQPSSFRAIKLYSDFGFRLITDARVGSRRNDLGQALPALHRAMPRPAFEALRFAPAPRALREASEGESFCEF